MPNRKIELSIMDNDLTTLTDEELDAVAAGASVKLEGKGEAEGLTKASVSIVAAGKAVTSKTGESAIGSQTLTIETA